MSNLISRQQAIDALYKEWENVSYDGDGYHIASECERVLDDLPPVHPERLTDDDFETIRIHLNAYKENLCNQRRWKEAEEYQHIIDRFMAFASTQPRTGMWIDIKHTFMTKCSVCDWINNDDSSYNFCPCCGADMRPQFEEPEINPCRGCEDYDGEGGCKSKGGCADRRGDSDDNH